jgi:hypothetical protein
MTPEHLASIERDWMSAYNAERDGNYAEALRLYRLVSGAGAMISATEKDGLRIEFGKLDAKIAELVTLVGQSSGSGKVRQIPMHFQRTGSNSVHTDDGYAWGY